MIYDLVLKWSGLGWVWDKLDGYKTFIAAIAGILTGLLGVLDELVPLLNAHKIGPILAWVRDLPNDQSWLMILGGLAVLGIGHKIAKQAEVITPKL